MPAQSQERPAQSNPHQPLEIYCDLAAASLTVQPFWMRPTCTVETRQLGYSPGIECNDLDGYSTASASEEQSVGSRLQMPVEPQSKGPRPDVEISIVVRIWAVSPVVSRRDTASVSHIV
jgi:hypothetical protein